MNTSQSSASQNITILGATGSIGVSTLDVVQRHSDAFNVFALTANTNVELLFSQCERHKPQFAVMRDEAQAERLISKLKSAGSAPNVLSGSEGLDWVAGHEETDVVMAAIVGAAGLQSSLRAAETGKRLLLANKESLVMSGALFMRKVQENNAVLLPIDSEHNAIFQSLANGAPGYAGGVAKIYLTASGGPLRGTPLADLHGVTVEQACAHPNWDMGRKISVDSATMMNKGLELIEAHWLFDVPVQQIEIVIHPQQIIHSMVAYHDGSVVSQMGNPDMRTPIAHGLAWPSRIDSGVTDLDLMTMGRLDFEPADRHRFPCIALAEEAANGADSLSIALNASNEIAVEGFLNELIRFTDIPIIVEKVLAQVDAQAVGDVDEILAVDDIARIYAREILRQRQI